MRLTTLAVMAQTAAAVAIPRLGLGSAEGPPHEAMASAVEAAVRSGVLMIDTAQNYGSEAAIGDGLRRSGRDDVFVLCKVDLCTRSREDPRRRMRRQVTESKRKLGRVDAVALHWPLLLDAPSEADARAVRADAWRELEAMVDEGLVGCLGLSNFDVELMDEIIALARHPPVLNEVEMSPRCYQAELLAACEARGVRVVGYSPYGTCWLAKYFPDFALARGKRPRRRDGRGRRGRGRVHAGAGLRGLGHGQGRLADPEEPRPGARPRDGALPGRRRAHGRPGRAARRAPRPAARRRGVPGGPRAHHRVAGLRLGPDISGLFVYLSNNTVAELSGSVPRWFFKEPARLGASAAPLAPLVRRY